MSGTALISHIVLRIFSLVPNVEYPAVTQSETIKEALAHRALSPHVAPHLLNAHPRKMWLHELTVSRHCAVGVDLATRIKTENQSRVQFRNCAIWWWLHGAGWGGCYRKNNDMFSDGSEVWHSLKVESEFSPASLMGTGKEMMRGDLESEWFPADKYCKCMLFS